MEDKPVQRTVNFNGVRYDIRASRPLSQEEANEVLQWYLDAHPDSKDDEDRVTILSLY